jgi:hypothetical protein
MRVIIFYLFDNAENRLVSAKNKPRVGQNKLVASSTEVGKKKDDLMH